MKKSAKILIIIMLIPAVALTAFAVTAIATNPSPDDFCEWFVGQYLGDIQQWPELPDYGILGGILNFISGGMLDSFTSSMPTTRGELKDMLKLLVDHRSYVFYSIYILGDEAIVVGVFGRFYNLTEILGGY